MNVGDVEFAGTRQLMGRQEVVKAKGRGVVMCWVSGSFNG